MSNSLTLSSTPTKITLDTMITRTPQGRPGKRTICHCYGHNTKVVHNYILIGYHILTGKRIYNHNYDNKHTDIIKTTRNQCTTIDECHDTKEIVKTNPRIVDPRSKESHGFKISKVPSKIGIFNSVTFPFELSICYQ